MKKMLTAVATAVVCLVVFNHPLEAEEVAINIKVSPNVINVASTSTVVTVHTNIPFSAVVGSTVQLNGVEIAWWKADCQGNFVAKFEASDVKGIVEPGTTATLTLVGETVTGDSFVGSADVKVVDVKQKK